MKFKRVLIKLSGEALAGEDRFGLDDATVTKICKQIKTIHDMGIQVAIVVGGGNFWRGRSAGDLDKCSADYMGMLATVMNALALQNVLENNGMPSRVMSAIAMNTICEPYSNRKAMHHLDKDRIVIFAAGTGNPFFTTDTAAALRAVEVRADAILLAKNVDAVYSSDPKEDAQAIRYEELTYDDLIRNDLKVMDQAAVTLCKTNRIPIQVFSLRNADNLVKTINGENPGTIIRS